MNTQARGPDRPATCRDSMVAENTNGRLQLHPRPALRHSRATLGMAGRLDARSGGGAPSGSGWHFAIKPELHLGPAVRVPDLAAWRRETRARLLSLGTPARITRLLVVVT